MNFSSADVAALQTALAAGLHTDRLTISGFVFSASEVPDKKPNARNTARTYAAEHSPFVSPQLSFGVPLCEATPKGAGFQALHRPRRHLRPDARLVSGGARRLPLESFFLACECNTTRALHTCAHKVQRSAYQVRRALWLRTQEYVGRPRVAS